MSGKVFLQERPTETYGETDWLLRTIVKAINEREPASDQRIRLTLLLNGFLASGEPVSSREYFKGAAGLPEIAGSIARGGRWDEEKADEHHVGYIHLKNARLFHPGGKPVAQSLPAWWRIKLSAVSGFTIGDMS